MRFFRAAITGVAVCCAFAPAARAQDAFDAPPPHIAFVDGSVTLDREDLSEPAMPGAPLVPGDRVRTERGRVEVLFPDGSALDVDEDSSFELQAPALLRVTSGRVLLIVAGAGNPASATHFQIDTPVASAQTDGPGEYRVSIFSGPSGIETELAVVRGSGALVTERGSVPLRAGERSMAWDNALPSAPQFFNSARLDAFDQWARIRRDERLGSRSAQYLPTDLRTYSGDLDRYGSWQYDAQYGNVWYPQVAPDWRPYYDGYWSSVPSYGWTWIGVEAWSWPTHHYGRWGYGGSRWFWIPDRRYSSAWVSWGGAPGYVSWCPLGFDNRPVFALSVSTRSTWTGWTVLPRDHFGGRGRNVHQYAVSPRALPANTRFIARASAPVAAPRAVPRRAAGGAGQPAGVYDRRPAVGTRQSPTGGYRTSGDGRPSAGTTRQPGAAARQAPPAGQPPSAGRSPQAVRRQPQTEPSQPVQPADRPQYDRRDPGVFRSPQPDTGRRAPGAPDSMIYTNRSRVDRPSAPGSTPPQATAPGAPPAPERPRSGTAIRRSESARPPAPAPAPESQAAPMPRRSPGAAPRYERPQAPPRYERPQAPPPAAAAPPPQRAERPSPPPSQRETPQARPRGHERQQSSSSSPPPERQQSGRATRRPR